MYNNRHFGCLTLVVIISFGPTAAKNASTIDDDIDDDIDDFIPYRGERFDTFDWNLFKVMAKKYFGNMLISPISAKLAMINLYEGAEGQTAQELSNAMHLPINRAVTRDKFTYILNSLQAKNPAYSLNIGTRMYIDSAVQLRQRYAAIIKMLYATDVMNENLSDIHATADSINNWVKNITENNIDKIIEDEKILKGSVMVVVNALFFKGTWDRQPFSEKATKTGKFYPTATSNIDVLMMHSYGRFYYSSSTELDAKILRIPYSGHKYAAYFILPRKMSALDPLIEKLNSSAFSRQMWLMQDISIAVGIPKFKFDFTSHLESTFRELGIQEIFEDSATLTGILRTNRSSPQLSVSDILQKSGIEVNEKGTAAYVATEIQISNKIGEDNFIANRPFIFYIEDETTGVILFIGKVENPLQGTGNTNMASNLSTRFGEENKETNGDQFYILSDT